MVHHCLANVEISVSNLMVVHLLPNSFVVLIWGLLGTPKLLD